MNNIPPNISFIILFIWLLLFLGGKYQLKKIKEYTVKIVEDHAKSALQKNPELSIDAYYRLIFPIWKDEVKKYWFIPHRSELFPIRTSPENIGKRINFTPEWVGAYLELKEIHLKRNKQQSEKIKEIIALSARK